MKRTILATFILAVIVAVGALGAVAAGDEEGQVPVEEVAVGLPNLCEQAYDSITAEIYTRGRSKHVDTPSLVTSNEAGNCVVTIDRREGYAPREVAFKWNGVDLGTIPVDPEGEIDAQGWIYTWDVIVKADGSIEIKPYDPLRQVWYCGPKIGECVAGDTDAYFSPECQLASHDPAYLALHKPGTGPACLAHTYEKQCTIDPVTNEEHCPVVIVD